MNSSKKVARIFNDPCGGGYHVCSDDLDFLDTRGAKFKSKAAAMRAAIAEGYTHCIGSGTYKHGVHKL